MEFSERFAPQFLRICYAARGQGNERPADRAAQLRPIL